MSPLRDKLFVISLIVLTALAIAAVPRIHAAAPVAVVGISAHPTVNDDAVVAGAKSRLAAAVGVKGASISVKSVNGVVTLAGVQPGQQAVDKALAATLTTSGVRDVEHAALISLRH